MVPRRDRPSQTWKTFLHNHADGIASIDLFVVPTIAFEQLFAFLILGHGRRQLLWFAVTWHPTAEWVARQITEAFPWDRAPTYIVRDNDRAFGSVFTRRIQAMGIRDRPTSFRSPWQNGHVERLIGSIRRECTDHLIVLNEEHLRRILTKFASYYNGSRPHVSLGKDAPDRRPIELRGHRRTCNLGRIASPLRTNLVFGSDRHCKTNVRFGPIGDIDFDYSIIGTGEDCPPSTPLIVFDYRVAACPCTHDNARGFRGRESARAVC
jgi:Integrase core domain